MNELPALARLIIFAGLALVVIGVLLLVIGRVPFLGRLPGDITFQRGNVTFYFPLMTMILLSLVLTVLLNIFLRR